MLIDTTNESDFYVVSEQSLISSGEVLTPAKQLVEFLDLKERKIGDKVEFTVKKYSTNATETISITLKQYIYGNKEN